MKQAGLAGVTLKGAIARPPLRPNEVCVTRRLPLVVYVRRCIKLLEGSHSEISILGTGGCVPTAVLVAQDVISNMGGGVTFEADLPPQNFKHSSANEYRGHGRDHDESLSLEAKGRSLFAASAVHLTKACTGNSQCARVAMHIRTKTVEASDECVEMSDITVVPAGGDELEAELRTAGINMGTVQAIVRKRNINAIEILLRKV